MAEIIDPFDQGSSSGIVDPFDTTQRPIQEPVAEYEGFFQVLLALVKVLEKLGAR